MSGRKSSPPPLTSSGTFLDHLTRRGQQRPIRHENTSTTLLFLYSIHRRLKGRDETRVRGSYTEPIDLRRCLAVAVAATSSIPKDVALVGGDVVGGAEGRVVAHEGVVMERARVVGLRVRVVRLPFSFGVYAVECLHFLRFSVAPKTQQCEGEVSLSRGGLPAYFLLPLDLLRPLSWSV